MAEIINAAADPEANIIFGAVVDEALGDTLWVTVVAAGFDVTSEEPAPEQRGTARQDTAAARQTPVQESVGDRSRRTGARACRAVPGSAPAKLRGSERGEPTGGPGRRGVWRSRPSCGRSAGGGGRGRIGTVGGAPRPQSALDALRSRSK